MESMVIETTSSRPTAPAADDPQLTKFSGDASPPPQPSSVPATTTACFDCNICLDFAAEPVVTLCGHLYCWPCLYRWLQRDACPGGDSPASSPPQCPVCKTAVSQATLVPIYGRGGAKPSADVPRRPAVQHHRKQGTPTSSVQQQHHHRRHRHQHQHDRRSAEEDYVNAVISPSPAINPMLRGTAFAVLPWVSSDLYCARSPYYLIGAGENAAAQRQELQSRRSLHRISVFLLCGVILCLFCF